MGRKRKIDTAGLMYENHFGRQGFTKPNPNILREQMLVNMYERVLGELAMNRFKWEGLPPEIDVRYLEMSLLNSALAVFFKDDVGNPAQNRPGTDKFFAMPAAPVGRPNVLMNPTAFTIVAPGDTFQGMRISAKRCVPIWANYYRTPDWDIISIYAYKLGQIDRTIEINVNNARRTKVLVYDENTRLTAENINSQIDAGEPTIRVNTNVGQSLMDGTMISALDLGVDPLNLEKLSIMRARLWNEAMGMLGINNANQDKKERLVSDEVDANDDQVDTMRRVTLNARQSAADQINQMFGLNVSVDYHTTLNAEQPASALDEEMDSDNGSLYA